MTAPTTALACLRCDGPHHPRLSVCLSCAASWDGETTRQFEQARDNLAAWIIEAEQVLAELGPDDPRYVAGKAQWEQRLATYQQLVYLLPETAP